MLYFAPDRVPVLAHPTVQSLGQVRRQKLLGHALLSHLDFTKHLELRVINAVLKEIVLGEFPYPTPPFMTLEATNIITDESFHAQFSAHMHDEVVRDARLTPVVAGLPRPLVRFGEIRNSLPADLSPLATAFFAVASETLISSTLEEIPSDDRVIEGVRLLIADHANDERGHRAYFTTFLEILWDAMTEAERSTIGPLLPRFVVDFLMTDRDAVAAMLTSVGLTDADARRVVAETYPPDQDSAQFRKAAGWTVQAAYRIGLLDHPRVLDAFGTAGLLPAD